MATFNLTIGGIDKLKKLARNAPKARQAVKAEIYQFSEEVMSDSKEIVPVRTGNLMNTGKVLLPTEQGNTVTVQMGYGDSAVGYAIYVHEALEGPNPIDPNWSWAKKVARGGQIDWTRPGSGPKYLERPLKAKQDQLPGRVGDAYRNALKS